jgi:hypothetical protein
MLINPLFTYHSDTAAEHYPSSESIHHVWFCLDFLMHVAVMHGRRTLGGVTEVAD